PPLIAHFLQTVAARLGHAPKSVAPDAYRALLAHDWPGNVRELEHGIEQATVLAAGDEIQLDDLPAELRVHGAAGSVPAPADQSTPPAGPDPAGGFKESKQRVIEQFERRFIAEALSRHRGNISKAAEEMGMYRQHLQVKLAEYGIDAGAFKSRTTDEHR